MRRDAELATSLDTQGREFGSYQRVKADTRLSVEDRHKLDSYLALIGDLQNDAAMPGAACPAPGLQTEPTYIPISGATGSVIEAQQAIEDFRIRNQIRITAAAMMCDLTRVAATD